MDEYPTNWQAGDVIGRNLIPRPCFKVGDSPPPWSPTSATIDTRAGVRRGWARLGEFATTARVPISGLTITADAGKTVRVWFEGYSTINAVEVYITGKGGNPDPLYGARLVLTTSVPTGYGQKWEGTVVLPAGPFTNDFGDPVNPDDTYELTALGDPNNTGISAARVDLASSPVTEYFDGHDTDDTQITPAWTGTERNSVSVGTAIAAGGEPVDTPVTATAPTFNDSAYEYTIPATEGVEYLVGSTPTGDGTYPATPEETVTVTAEATPGYVLDGVAEWTHTYPATTDPNPDPEPEPDPGALAAELAPIVLAYAGKRSTEAAVTQAEAHVEVVADFVRGYTRGRGWETGEPARPLRSVIISATARLVNNPRQLSYYGIADYNERPAVLNGYTLTELGVLHNYRRRQA